MRSRPRPLAAVAALFHQILLLLVVLVLHFPSVTESYECYIFRDKLKVQVINRIAPSGLEPIKVHCLSKDDDLGWHTLATKERFEFRFCVTPLFTFFVCEITWARYHTVYFRAYDATSGYDPCGRSTDGTCVWEVLRRESDGGIYVSRPW